MKTLLCLLSHPTQYDQGLWATIGRRGIVAPEVWYDSEGPRKDPELGRSVNMVRQQWPYRLVPDAQLRKALRARRDKHSAILTAGWTKRRSWIAWNHARGTHEPLILPSDKTLNEPGRGQFIETIIGLGHILKTRAFHGYLTTGTLGRLALMSHGAPPDRIATGLYPIDCDWWRARLRDCFEASEAFRARVGGRVTFLAVSKWSERESPLPLLDAFSRAALVDPGLRLVLVGDGPLRSLVEGRIRALHLSDRVQLPGYVPYEDLAVFYGSSDVFIHVPSREPWGISVAEALACSIPVIASTAVGSGADLLIHGLNGLLVSPDSESDLESALLTASTWIPLTPARQAACRQHAERVGQRASAEELEQLVGGLDRFPARPAIWSTLRSIYRNHYAMWSR